VVPGDIPPPVIELSIDDLAVTEPDGAGGFTVSLSTASSDTVTVDYASADGTALSPDDYSAVSGTLSFDPGMTSQPVAVTVVDDDAAEGAETFTVSLANPVAATLGAASTGTATITDDAPSACGLPAYDKATEQGVFVGKDCATGLWRVRMTAGSANVSYRGGVVSDEPFSSVAPFSVESSDTLDFTTDPGQIVYILNVDASWQDGFNFSLPVGAQACFDLDAPAGAVVEVGAVGTPVSVPFDLATLGPCP
jgi:hypothetical protein